MFLLFLDGRSTHLIASFFLVTQAFTHVLQLLWRDTGLSDGVLAVSLFEFGDMLLNTFNIFCQFIAGLDDSIFSFLMI